jgi:hypothetical protein
MTRPWSPVQVKQWRGHDSKKPKDPTREDGKLRGPSQKSVESCEIRSFVQFEEKLTTRDHMQKGAGSRRLGKQHRAKEAMNWAEVVGLIWSSWESLVLRRYYKWDVVKTRQASHGLTETRQKGHWKIMLYQGGGEKNTHTWDRWTCANGKEWSRCTKEVLVIGLHMVGKMSMDLLSWDLEIPNAL